MKLKICSRCSKERPIWKNKTVDGEKLQYCQPCWRIVDRETQKEKKRTQRKKKQDRITEKKLDSIFSLLVRNIYPPFCHSSGVSITVETCQCAHLIGRSNRCVRFDMRNCYPTTPQENMYVQTHVIYLAKRLKEYYNIDFEDFDSAAKQNTCKLSFLDRKRLYDIFKRGLEKISDIKKIQDLTKQKKALQNLRLEIIEQTKFVL